MSTLQESREALRRVLDLTDASEAPTTYYALFHDAKRSTLAVRTDAQGTAQGFVGRFQTGIDLFRPVICMRCRTPDLAAELLAETCAAGRPYVLFSNLNQLPMVGGSMQVSNERILSIFVLEPSRFKPAGINVLIQHKAGPDGSPRVEIVSNGQQAVAGVNWQSPGFAEIYVHTDPDVRQKGWGMSVTAALIERLLKNGRLPIYLVEPNNEPSVRLARSLGFADTGARQVLADTIYTGHPGKQRA
jgi:ribosomal protein S18 acetylase RimI-like enzyme